MNEMNVKSSALSLLFLLVLMLVPLFAGRTLFQDNFDSGSSANWQPLNSGNWQVASDLGDYAYNLRSSSYALPGANQLGEYSMISGLTRMNFVFECDLRSTETSSNTSANLGIVFGYRDAANYYNMVFCRSANSTELSVVKKGLGTSLASYASGLLLDNAYHHAKIVRVGKSIQVYFDGALIISLEDDNFMTGQLGVGSRNDAGFFDNIRIDDFEGTLASPIVLDSLTSPAASPYGITWDGSNVWLGDTADKKVLKLSATGQTLSQFSLPEAITPVAMQWVSPSYLWIADFKTDLINKVDISSQTKLSSMGTPGGVCTGLSWDGSHFWITDGNRNAIYEFDSNGNMITSFLGPSSNHTGIAWDGTYLWVLSNADPYLFKIDRTGQLQAIFDIPGGEPRDIAYDGQYFWMTDGATKKIYRFSVNGAVPPVTSNISLTFNQIDPSQFSRIAAYVTVTDQSGNPILGLNSSNFTVQENNVLQSPITVTTVGGTSAPVAVALVLDRSGSMLGTPLADAKTAALAFVNNLGTNDRAAVISFESTVRVDQGFTNNKTVITTAINKLTATGATALYDAIVAGVTQANAQSGRKAIIALSDGDDNISSYDLNGCINQARSAGLPVFTIGLGSVNAQVLQRIANETGGRYFNAPTSSDLLQIYQLISQQLQNQYLISYTTSNSSYDCSSRNVQITVTSQGNNDSKTKAYQAPCTQNVPIFPACTASSVFAGQDFWLDIQIGNSSQPVSDLFAVSFVLNYATTYLDVVTPSASAVVAGSFIGSDLVFFQDVNESSGAVSVGVSRKASAGGVNGAGSVARIHLLSSTATPNNTVFNFTLASLSAIDPNGSPIVLSPQSCTITVMAGASVWPGDTYNDGYVDQADILPMGTYFGKTGASRGGAPNNLWQGQNCTPQWNPVLATYADCDGNGVINQSDVFAIGLNWHKSHTLALAKPEHMSRVDLSLGKAVIYPVTDSTIQQNSEFLVLVKVRDASGLFGIAFQLTVDDTEYVSIKDATLGELLGNDLLALPPIIDSTLNTISVGMTRKAGQAGVSDSGTVLVARLKVDAATPRGKKIILRILNIKATDASGAPLELATLNDTIAVINTATQAETVPIGLPEGYALEQNFPNPFNPATSIKYRLPRPDHVHLTIHNTEGKSVRILVNGQESGGEHTVIWDGKNDYGFPVSAGIYFCHFSAGNFRNTVRMLLVK